MPHDAPAVAEADGADRDPPRPGEAGLEPRVGRDAGQGVAPRGGPAARGADRAEHFGPQEQHAAAVGQVAADADAVDAERAGGRG
ncbi:hypothetical protein, partial [Alienimonas sp. DA493]|uniref:hypothetical protein n=1 Tax=Alienimonas sp. DA493 TaxID=3373605 RepID=UPI003753FE0B